MQSQRSIFNPLSETVDLNQGSASNIAGMDESHDRNNMLSLMERRLLNNDLSSELNFGCVNMSGYHNSRSFSSWDVGESSSKANIQDQVSNDGVTVGQNWSSSFGTYDSRLEERLLESSNIHPSSGSQLAVRLLNIQSSGANHIPLNINLDVGFGGNNNDDGGHDRGFTNLYKSGRPETEAGGLSEGIGTSSEFGSGSSSCSWGLSCKRKALDGASGQPFTGGSSSCFPQAEDTVRHTVPVHDNASSSVSISPLLVNPLTLNPQEQLNTRIGVGMRGGVASDALPPSIPGVSESSHRHFGMRESIPFDISPTGNPARHSNISSSHQSSRRISPGEYMDQRSTGSIMVSADLSNLSDQPPLVHVAGMPRHVLPLPWSGNINSRSGSSSNSTALPGERGSWVNFRGTLRNNLQHHHFLPSNEMRNLVQHPTDWSLATGSTSTNGAGTSSSSRNGTGSGSHPFHDVWVPQCDPTTQNHRRSSEFPPWTPVPSAGAESGGHFPPFPSGFSSTSEDNRISSAINSQGRHHQPYSRSSLFTEVINDNWRAVAADIEGRQRVVSEIRQVLNAMRRSENLRAEDYMLFDPFINGVAELHDRHRDMRLDVDNMSYEELLALEERIGSVNTGLSDEVILKSMKQRKHIAFMAIPNLEPCCICQEEYHTGDDIGTLDCGHEFHPICIKQWLAQKNLCPICKMTGLAT